jgi:hypothetical protein
VREVLIHPWFSNIDRRAYLEKKVEAPVKFTGIKDLKLIFQEMEVKEEALTRELASQQKTELRQSHAPAFPNFYYDYRTPPASPPASRFSRSHKTGTRSASNLSNARYSGHGRDSRYRNHKSLRNMGSQRVMTGGGVTGRQRKPLSTRFLDVNLYLR